MSDWYFTARGLTVGYDGVPLIRDIQIGIDRGEIVALIGPNGSGKSTILKTIARQLKPLGGGVCLGGQYCAHHGYGRRSYTSTGYSA